MYQVFSTTIFDKQLTTLEKSDQDRINVFARQLRENPLIGKPLGLPFLREKKFEGKRMYFLIYDEWSVVLLALISGKKDQQEAIDWIKQHLPELREYVQKLVEKTTD
jgi:mRNA-degrading endonuclease RelE of RelBE toxin-antitoxin system